MVEEEIIVYVCHVHGKLTIEKVLKCGFRSGKQRFRCKQCFKLTRDKNYLNNREKILIANDNWRKSNPLANKESKINSWRKNKHKYKEKKREGDERYKLKNKIKIHERRVIYLNKQKKNITDVYIRLLLTRRTNLKAKDIPQKLIDLKREQIKLTRLIKDIENEQ